jgi:hypothetical protein
MSRFREISLVLLFISSIVYAGSNPVLETGINAFQQGKFDEARQAFSSLETNPSWKFAALYNLGNVAVRQNHLGEALGLYIRARHENPHDRDTLENIKFVISGLGARRLTGTPSNYDIFREQIIERFTFGELLVGTLLFSIFSLVTLLRYLRRKKLDQEVTLPTGLIIGFAVLAIFTSASATKLIDTYSQRGTIITDHVDLRSGPGEANASMMQVSEGSEVSINDVDHDWAQVSPASGGLMGWVPKSSLMMTSGGGPF